MIYMGASDLKVGVSHLEDLSCPAGVGYLGSIAHMVYVLLIEHKSSENMVSSYFDSDDPIRPQLCTCHDSWAVMTCAKLWPDLTNIFHMRATYVFTKFGSQAQNPVVKWTPVLRKYYLVESGCTMDPVPDITHIYKYVLLFIFKCIFNNKNIWILNKISLKYVPLGLIDNMAALFQIMACCRTGNNPLSEAMLVCCTDAYMRHPASMS